VKRRDGSALFVPPFWPVADDRVRFVGDIVALVVAETVAQAKDAAELIEVSYSPLPSVTATAAALDPASARLWDEVENNEAFVFEVGDRAKADAAFAAAATVCASISPSRVCWPTR